MSTHPALGFFDDGSDLTAPAFYEAVRRPFGEASLLPPVAYRSKVFADLEDEKLWTRTWVCIGSTQQIPNAGDLLPYTIGNHGIHVQRAPDGSLTGRFNKAQHGGCRFVPAQCQTGKKTKCSYTSCGYSRDRDVVLASELEDAHRLSNQYLGDRPERLLRVNVAGLGPLVFVNLDPDTAPMDGHAGHPWHRLKPWLGSPLVDLAGRWVEHVCNWKLAGRAFMGLGSGGTAAGGATHTMRTVKLDDVPACSAMGELPRFPQVPGSDSGTATLCWIFPNLLLGLMADHVASVVLQPTATSQVIQRLRIFVDPAAASSAEAPRFAEQLTTFWDGMLQKAAADAVEAQARVVAVAAASDADGAPAVPRREGNPCGHEFQQFLVGAVLAEHDYDRNAPLYAPSGR